MACVFEKPFCQGCFTRHATRSSKLRLATRTGGRSASWAREHLWFLLQAHRACSHLVRQPQTFNRDSNKWETMLANCTRSHLQVSWNFNTGSRWLRSSKFVRMNAWMQQRTQLQKQPRPICDRDTFLILQVGRLSSRGRLSLWHFQNLFLMQTVSLHEASIVKFEQARLREQARVCLLGGGSRKEASLSFSMDEWLRPMLFESGKTRPGPSAPTALPLTGTCGPWTAAARPRQRCKK